MQLNFESLAELQDFVAWVQSHQAAAQVLSSTARAIDTLAAEMAAPMAEMASPDGEAEQKAEDEEPAAKTVTVRKRRTKAEMEAARAAEVANPTDAPAESPAETPGASEARGTESSAAVAETSASAPITDAQDFMRARIAERPEVSQVEHLNLARTFIGKHGMEKYNQSFPLAGLTPNVMGYSPADCATHAAALDFLSLE